MLTQLSTIKSRLAIDPFDLQYDDLLTNAITAVSFRFDNETNRTLARTVNFTQEFETDDTEIPLACYPVESVTKFELKQNETEGWIEQTNIEYLIRNRCILSLPSAICHLPSPSVARVTYTGGFVLPGATVGAGQTPLPSDLESACVEQVAAWFQNRDKLGLDTIWPHAGTYQKFNQLDLLSSVQAALRRHARFNI